MSRVIEPEIKQFTASDGYRLHYRHWRPNLSKPKGYVVALHGIQSHSGWYEYSSRKLCEAGYAIDFLDRRGSGLNHAARGDAVHHERLINDVAQFLSHVRFERNRTSPTSPVILLAVSWSGKLAAATAARRAELADALALLYPGIRARVQPTALQQFQLRLAELADVRDKLVPIPLDDPALFTGDPQWQQFIRDDALSLHQVTVGFLLANRELSRLAEAAPPRIRCPLLCMLAGQDQIIDNRSTRQYIESMASQHRTVTEYPQAQHTLEFEPDRDQFIADLLDWLNSIRPIC